ncbi:GGDEF domain-containing protein [Macrococcoides goetzii]|nr:GGDEF domain-containing protein [Macrococcus goetzii]
MSTLFSNIEQGNLSFRIEKSNFYLSRPCINQLNRMIQTLNKKIYYDNLTQLPNRVALLKHLDELSEHSDDISIYLFDIDGFKSINDNYGHHAGDELLFAVGKRLNEVLPKHLKLFRMAGDEFIIVSSNPQNIDSTTHKSKLHAILEEPFNIDGNTIQVNISVGSAKYDKTSQDFFTIIKQADTDMYTEKMTKKKDGDRYD